MNKIERENEKNAKIATILEAVDRIEKKLEILLEVSGISVIEEEVLTEK